MIHVDDNVLVDGSLERAASGNVVRFSCKSNTDTLVGPTEIYCDEHGLWSGDAPKCKGKSRLYKMKQEAEDGLLEKKEWNEEGKGK